MSFTLRGCFIDSNPRDIAMAFLRNSEIHPMYCADYCTNRNYQVFGLQNGNECWCDDNFGFYGQVSSEDCNMACAGDPSETCGGASRNSVYSIDKPSEEHYKYLGCYIDNPYDGHGRDLPIFIERDLTPEGCGETCKSARYPFFGLQSSGECRCGNSYGRYGIAAETDSFDDSKTCGGINRNSVYSISSYTYLGCYIDNVNRDLPFFVRQSSTPEDCGISCQSAGYQFFGLQYFGECRCGSNYGRYGIAAETDCDYPCNSDQSEKCGGDHRNSVYFIPSLNEPTTKPMGCFVDNGNNRDLAFDVVVSFIVSPSFCASHCSASGYLYFGLQHYNECWCGNSYGAYGQASAEECELECYFDKDSKCGGTFRNSVYEIENTRVNWAFVGCFVDAEARDLPFELRVSTSLSPDVCALHCFIHDYPFFGLQNGNECRCGSDYGEYGPANSITRCDAECAGAVDMNCGGVWKNAVYKIESFFQNSYEYLGCYVDGEIRDLPRNPTTSSAGPAECSAHCVTKGYQFFGLQNGNECRCGNNYGRYGKAVSNTECNSICSSDPASKCGGVHRNSVYVSINPVCGCQQSIATPTTESKGCYLDDSANPDLPNEFVSGYFVNEDFCARHCHSNGYTSFGLQHYNECWCGHSYGTYGATNEVQCDMPCYADNTTFCGGRFANSVYSIITSEDDYEFEAIGCFIDRAQRDLPFEFLKDSMLTPQLCSNHCARVGYPYFGLQNGNECWCGYTYGAYGPSSGNCNVSCAGGGNCGDFFRNSVYRVIKFFSNEYKYLGCFKDDDTVRDLPENAMEDISDQEKCSNFCQSSGFLFFGLQNGDECRCGKKYGSYGVAPAAECDAPCNNSSDQECGGSMRNSVFYIPGLSTPTHHFVDCFVEDPNRREFTLLAVSNPLITPALCAGICEDYNFFGLQHYDECWCGNSVGRFGIAENCDTPCYSNNPTDNSTSDNSTMCGGFFRNSVYLVET